MTAQAWMILLTGIAAFASCAGIPASVYAVFVARSSKRGSDTAQLAIDLTANSDFREKVISAVIYDDKFRERCRELATDRLQLAVNERHIVSGNEDREFKDGLRRELDDLKGSIEGLRNDVRLVLRRTDGSRSSS